MKIVIDSDIPYVRGVLEPYARVSYVKGSAIGRADVADADALVVRTRTRCDRALLEGSAVRVIASATIGFDHIDTEYCRAAGIRVATAAGSNARAVLQWVGAVLVHASQVQGWRPEERTLGVVGVGHVGTLVARYAALWGFRTVCCDPPRAEKGEKAPDGADFADFGTLSAGCDIMTFHTPLTAEGPWPTYHMAGSVPRGTLVLNSSRGAVVDTAALVAGGCACAIDTWENEPDIDRRLLAGALVATPHIAGYSAQGKANASSMAVGAVSEALGLPLTGWYPAEVPRVEPRPLSWEEFSRTVGAYFDVAAQTAALRAAPGDFEAMRDNYAYRTEYF